MYIQSWKFIIYCFMCIISCIVVVKIEEHDNTHAWWLQLYITYALRTIWHSLMYVALLLAFPTLRTIELLNPIGIVSYSNGNHDSCKCSCWIAWSNLRCITRRRSNQTFFFFSFLYKCSYKPSTIVFTIKPITFSMSLAHNLVLSQHIVHFLVAI